MPGSTNDRLLAIVDQPVSFFAWNGSRKVRFSRLGESERNELDLVTLAITEVEEPAGAALPDLPPDAQSPAPSPSGRRIAFTLPDEELAGGAEDMGPDSEEDALDAAHEYVQSTTLHLQIDGQVQAVGRVGGTVANAKWFDGERRLLVSTPETQDAFVYVVETDDQGQAKPVLRPFIDVEEASYANAAVSPDGSRLAYRRYWNGQREVGTIDLASGQRTPIPVQGVDVVDLAWFPDGQALLVLAYDPATDSQAFFHLRLEGLLQPLPGGAPPGLVVGDWQLSPDGRRILLVPAPISAIPDRLYLLDLEVPVAAPPGIEVEEPAGAGEATYPGVTNDNIIQAFHDADPSPWKLMTRAQLSLNALAAARKAPYTGRRIEDMKLGSEATQALLSRLQAGPTPPGEETIKPHTSGAPFHLLPVDPKQVNWFNYYGNTIFSYIDRWSPPKDQWYFYLRGMHNGLDFGIDYGTDLLAIADGTVKSVCINTTVQDWCDPSPRKTGCRPLLGAGPSAIVLEVMVNGKSYLINYGHISALAKPWKVGDPVKAGEVIAQSGNPCGLKVGRRKNGTVGRCGNDHLHFEIRTDFGQPAPQDKNFILQKGRALNPMSLIDADWSFLEKRVARDRYGMQFFRGCNNTRWLDPYDQPDVYTKLKLNNQPDYLMPTCDDYKLPENLGL